MAVYKKMECSRHLTGEFIPENACVMMSPMSSLQIRDLPADVYEALAYRAERAGRSLTQQALFELRRAAPHAGRERRLAALQRIANRPGPARRSRLTAPEELIRGDRER